MQGNERYRLIVRRGPQPNQVFELADSAVNLGRDITNTIVINDREVSRHHLRFTAGPEGYTVEDLGSTNGTFVNGKRVTGATLLKNGDLIGLGETVTLGYEMARPDGVGAGQASPARPQQPAEPQPAPYSPPQREPDSYSPPPAERPREEQPYQSQSPYQPPQQQPAYAAPQSNEPDSQDAYGGYYPAPQSGVQQGYEYDPYALREEEPNNTVRYLLFGCVGLMFFCCCITILGVVAVDTLNLYCDIPVVNNVLEAVGLIRCG